MNPSLLQMLSENEQILESFAPDISLSKEDLKEDKSDRIDFGIFVAASFFFFLLLLNMVVHYFRTGSFETMALVYFVFWGIPLFISFFNWFKKMQYQKQTRYFVLTNQRLLEMDESRKKIVKRLPLSHIEKVITGDKKVTLILNDKNPANYEYLDSLADPAFAGKTIERAVRIANHPEEVLEEMENETKSIARPYR